MSRSNSATSSITEQEQFMSKKSKKPKPMDPVEVARLAYEDRKRRRDPASWGANEAALALATANDIRDKPEERGKVRQIRRYDVFSLLLSRDGLTDHQFQAARRFQDDLACEHRVDGGASESVPGHHGSAELMTARSIEAGSRMLAIQDHIGLEAAKLMLALSVPTIIRGERVNWRKVVQDSTGEHRPVEQSAHVVKTCQRINVAYTLLDQGDLKVRRYGDAARAVA